jgi:hypothetical protein
MDDSWLQWFQGIEQEEIDEQKRNIEKIAPALHKAQGQIKAALKDSTNPHFRSKYADLSSVIEAVKPAPSERDHLLQGVHDAVDGVAVETMLLHTSGEWISSVMRIPAVKQDAQGYGSAITYGRRYGLQSMCGVPAEDDDGNAATASTTSRITPVAGSLQNLTKEEQETAKEIAADIVEKWTTGKEVAAYEAFYEANLSNEMKLGVWDVLTPNSKVRNGIKKISDQNKQKAA